MLRLYTRDLSESNLASVVRHFVSFLSYVPSHLIGSEDLGPGYFRVSKVSNTFHVLHSLIYCAFPYIYDKETLRCGCFRALRRVRRLQLQQ